MSMPEERGRPPLRCRLTALRRLAAALTFAISPLAPAMAAGSQDPGWPQLGRPAGDDATEGRAVTVAPDGAGLPEGAGTAREGREIYRLRCAACHGLEGEGIEAGPRLVGGEVVAGRKPVKTVGSYWPHATTLYDYIRRAMPADAPKSLGDSEVYAVSAYLLFLNGLIGLEETLDGRRLREVRMPRRGAFEDRSHILYEEPGAAALP